jgi:hypothetical protein
MKDALLLQFSRGLFVVKRNERATAGQGKGEKTKQGASSNSAFSQSQRNSKVT